MSVEGRVVGLLRKARARIRNRICLRCGHEFLSVGPGNRICEGCQEYFRRFRPLQPPMPKRPRWILPEPSDDEEEDDGDAPGAVWYGAMVSRPWWR